MLAQLCDVPVIHPEVVSWVVPADVVPEVLVQSSQVEDVVTPDASEPVNTLSVTTLPCSSMSMPLVSGDESVFHNAARVVAISLPSIL